MEIKDLTKIVVDFCERREWKQFHRPKDMALALSIEANEVAEHFLWRDEKETEKHVKMHRQEIGEELADVFYWLLLMSYYYKVDLSDAFVKKMEKNEVRYPVEKSKGNHKKYTEL